mgnify:CR=1 FL=1
MANPVPETTRVVASHLYDFAACEHRIALDTRLDRARRTPPDDAMRLLAEHGRRFEEKIARELGYPEVRVEEDDWERAARDTLDLMRRGERGIYQGVLLDGRRLARPDLLERADGESAVGSWHYVPGDVKSAVEARSDGALQVGFAGLLLEAVQRRHPAHGFLILGDGSRWWFETGSIRRSLEDSLERVEAIAEGREDTFPFFSRHCGRCRWRDACLPGLVARRDASLVWGLTRTRRSVYARHGIGTVDDLARSEATALRRAGAPTDGLESLKRQARALLDGKAVAVRAVDLPEGAPREHYVRIETDPLDPGDAFLVAWGSGGPRGGPLAETGVALGGGPAERVAAFRSLAAALGGGREPVFHFGRQTARALDSLGREARIEPAVLGALEGRLVDLSPAVRNAAALPVRLYRFEEVAAFAEARPLPEPGEPDDALFVTFALLRESADPDPLRERLSAAGRDAVVSLRALRRFLAERAR